METNNKKKLGWINWRVRIKVKWTSKDCHFENLTALQYKDEAVLSTLISGIEDTFMRQRLLENEALTLTEALKQAEVLKRAHENPQNFEVAENFKPSVISIETNCKEQEEINE